MAEQYGLGYVMSARPRRRWGLIAAIITGAVVLAAAGGTAVALALASGGSNGPKAAAAAPATSAPSPTPSPSVTAVTPSAEQACAIFRREAGKREPSLDELHLAASYAVGSSDTGVALAGLLIRDGIDRYRAQFAKGITPEEQARQVNIIYDMGRQAVGFCGRAGH